MKYRFWSFLILIVILLVCYFLATNDSDNHKSTPSDGISLQP